MKLIEHPHEMGVGEMGMNCFNKTCLLCTG